MEPPIDRIRLSQTAKDQLTKLKRVTKIDQWNILSGRLSLSSRANHPSPVPFQQQRGDVLARFWGEISDILLIALKQRCHNDNLGTEHETLAISMPPPASRNCLFSWRSKS